MYNFAIRVKRSAEGTGTPLQYSCLENPMDSGAWKAAVHGVAEAQTRLSDFTFTFHFHALEKEMATHSSVLAWRIPGMGGAWWAAIYGVAQSRTRLKRLSSSSSSTACGILVPQPGPMAVKGPSPKHWTARDLPTWPLFRWSYRARL